MRRRYFRHASTLILAATLPLKLLAQQPTPVTPPVTPPASPAAPAPADPPAPPAVNPAAPATAVAPGNPPAAGTPVAPGTPAVPALPPGAGSPPAVGLGGLPGLPPGAVVGTDVYRAATPYNATVVGRAAPNPAYNRCNMTLPCINPNQNFAPLEIIPPECLGNKLWGIFAHFTKYSGGAGGCCGGAVGGCDGFLPAGDWGVADAGAPVNAKPVAAGAIAPVGFFQFIRGNRDGYDNGPTVHGVGSCATCGNTANFVFGSSRSFFGESSREFFERPPAVDGARFKVNPPPMIYRQHPYYAPPPPRAVPANLASLQPQ